MKLPNKLPANMQEAKTMFNELYEQVVEKVTEICNKTGKPSEQGEKKAESAASVSPATEVKSAEPEKPAAAPVEEKKDSENPPV